MQLHTETMVILSLTVLNTDQVLERGAPHSEQLLDQNLMTLWSHSERKVKQILSVNLVEVI